MESEQRAQIEDLEPKERLKELLKFHLPKNATDVFLFQNSAAFEGEQVCFPISSTLEYDGVLGTASKEWMFFQFCSRSK